MNFEVFENIVTPRPYSDEIIGSAANMNQWFSEMEEKISEVVSDFYKKEDEEIERILRQNAVPKIEGEITAEKLESLGIVIGIHPNGDKEIFQNGVSISPVFPSMEKAFGIELRKADEYFVPTRNCKMKSNAYPDDGDELEIYK